MPDREQLADEAAQYVLGELNAAERADFEARLAASAELRALVRELEEGMAALALTAPQRPPPAKVWNRIEQAVAQEAGSPFNGWWRNGWAAAAACLLGWLLYAVWMHQSHPVAAPGTVVSEVSSQTRAPSMPSTPTEAQNAPRTSRTNLAPTPVATAQETAALRRQISDLKAQVAQMSQSLAQQQALLGESNRLKFLQLTPVSGAGQEAAIGQLSPSLQRALFLAMARELGWLPDYSNTPGYVASTNGWNVDFVDLRPGGSNTTVHVPGAKQELENSTLNSTSTPTVAQNSTPTIPAFIAGENLILAIDSSMAPKGSSLSFSAGSTPETQQAYAGTVMGDNTIVVTIPINGVTANIAGGYYINVNSTTPSGSSTSMTFTLPPNSNP